MTNFKKYTVAALFGVALLSACSTGVKLGESAPVEDRSTGGSSKLSQASVNGIDLTGGGTSSLGANDPLNDPKSILAKRSIYFDFDSYIVKDEFKKMLEAHARYLSENKSRQVTIQGNTDDVGGSEYNLALGQRRADAVVKALSVLGVSQNQMEAVSFGKEKPKATGSSDTARSQNRRADLEY